MTVRLIAPPDKPERKKITRSRYTPQQKFDMVKEAEEAKDYHLTAKKHNVHPSSLYEWRNQIDNDPEGFLNKPEAVKQTKQYTQLKKENDELKECIVALSVELSIIKKQLKMSQD